MAYVVGYYDGTMPSGAHGRNTRAGSPDFHDCYRTASYGLLEIRFTTLPRGLAQGRGEERRMACQLVDVNPDVELGLARQLAERHDVLVGHVAEGEVHPPGNEVRDLDVEARSLVLDALHPMEAALLPALAAEDLQRRIAQPGLRDDLVARARPGARDELEQRPLAEGDGRDGAGLEVAMLANPRGVHAITRSVEVHEAGVEVP